MLIYNEKLNMREKILHVRDVSIILYHIILWPFYIICAVLWYRIRLIAKLIGIISVFF